MKEPNSYMAPELEADAPQIEPDADDAATDAAMSAFHADKRHIRFEDTPENWSRISDYLKQHDLPVTPCALALAFEQCADKLELTPLAPPMAADLKTAGEVKAEEDGEQEPSADTIQEQAQVMAKIFRDSKRNPIVYNNGRKVGAQTG